jgi:hypothetical protein
VFVVEVTFDLLEQGAYRDPENLGALLQREQPGVVGRSGRMWAVSETRSRRCVSSVPKGDIVAP